MEYLTGQQFDFRLESVSPENGYVLRSSRAKSGEKQENNLITNISMIVSIKESTQSNPITIGYARCQTLQQTWKIDEDSHLIFHLSLDHYTLSQVEELRNSGDLNLNFKIMFQAFVVGRAFHGEHSDLQDCSIYLDEQIAKSKWVEDILPKIGYKNVALVEIPVLEYRKLNKSIDILNRAWKSYSTGDIDDVLVKCR